MSYVIDVIEWVLSCVGLMYMFQKAGVPKWYAWIPILNVYWIVKISFSKIWAFIIYVSYICITIITDIIIFSYGMYDANYWLYLTEENLAEIAGTIAIILILVFIILVLLWIYRIYTAIQLCKVFGCSTGMVFLVAILPFIGYMVLGLGSAQYIGNNPYTIPPQNNGYQMY